MRMLVQETAPRHATVVEGLAAAAEARGHEVYIWREGVPAFDAFDESTPHIYVATRPGPPSRAEERCLAGRPNVRVVDRREDIRPAFDSLRFRPGAYDPALACDFCFVGSYRPEKAALIDEYLTPLFAAGLKGKLFGPLPMPYPEYLGPIAFETLPDLYRSASVCLDIGGGRMSERGYQIHGLGGVLAGTMSYGVPCTPDDFLGLVVSWVSYNNVYETKVRGSGPMNVASVHTYFHRLADILSEAGFARESELVLESPDAPPL